MLQEKKYNETELMSFERELLAVLKNDPDHRLDFDGKLLFRSRRHDCLLAATDVYWDRKSGDVILVGAFRSGKPVMDESKGYPVMKDRVAVPFRECFDDLRLSSGNEMKLISKARKAVIDKYLNSSMNWMKSKGLVEGGILNLISLDVGKFRINRADVVGLGVGSEGKITLLCSNSFASNFCTEASKIPISDIQSLGNQLVRFQDMYRSAASVYSETLRSENPRSMSFSQHDDQAATAAALLAVYDRNFPMKVCDMVAKDFAGSDVFDSSLHSASQIEKSVRSMREARVHKHHGISM